MLRWSIRGLNILIGYLHPSVLARLLVYEYVDNGNLDQWLHGDVGVVSPLTWDIRMKIILGTAKGYIISSMIFVSVSLG